MFNPDSPFSLAISNIFVLTLVIAAFILALVTGLVIYIAIRYRGKAGDPEPKQNYGFTKLEIGWTVAPALILGVLFIFTLDGMAKSAPSTAGKSPDIIVVGHQWWWEIRYPQANVVSANEIHMPTGKDMLVQIESADVIHDLWIPQLGRKMDMTPGYQRQLYLRADTPGTYQGACAEYCGAEHAWMLIRAIAQPQNEYDAWLQQQAAGQPVPTSGSAAQGWQLFQSKTCISCHAINGTAAKAVAGPNLTHFASRQTLGAGVLTNTPDNLSAWLANPQKVKPGVYMPNVQLTQEQLKSMVSYLETLK